MIWTLLAVALAAATALALHSLARRDRWTAPEIARGVRARAQYDRYARLVELTIGVDFLPEVEFEARRESAYSRLLKRLGVARELQVGDPAFDADVYLVCDDPRLAACLRDAPEARNALHELMRNAPRGFVVGDLTCRGLSPRARYATDGSGPDGKALREFVQPRLEAMRDALPRRGGVPRPRVDPVQRRAFALTSVAAALGTGGVFMLLRLFAPLEAAIVDRGELATIGAAVGVLAFAVLAVVTVRSLRGTSRLPSVLAVVLLAGGFGCLAGGIGIVREVNLVFDDSPVEALPATVVGGRHSVDTSRGGGRRHSYDVSFAGSALPDGGTFAVSAEQFEYLVPGTAVVVRRRAGALGIRWIERIDPAASATSAAPTDR